MQPVWIISHADLDGMAAAAVVKERYPQASVMVANYNKHIPLYKCKPGDLVYVTDFSLTYKDFMGLRQRGCQIVWIDHHEENYTKLADAGWSCEGIRRNDYCGAALTWMYLHPNVSPTQMPQAIKYVNDYDLWIFRYGDVTKNFALGIGLWDTRPGTKTGDALWKDLLASDESRRMDLILKYGEHVRQYIQLWQETICGDLAYYTEIDFNGGKKKILALPIRGGNSSVFDQMDKSNVDAVFQGVYVANIGKYRCSMYSPDNEKIILPIVLHYGGSGHPKAAGFVSPDYPLPCPPITPKPPDLHKSLAAYKTLADLRDSSIILKQWLAKAGSITIRANAFHTEFCGLSAIAANHQYIADVVNYASLSTDCIDPETQMPAKVYIGFVMTNSGWFRCGAYPTDNSTSLQAILELVKDRNEEAKRTAIIAHNGVWWYEKAAPVYIPSSGAIVPN